MKKLLPLLLLSIGCAKNPNPVFQIQGFESYYNSFVAQTGRSTDDLSISLSDNLSVSCPGTNVVGCCVYNNSPTVTVLTSYWNTSSEDLRQELIDHELGHCIIGRGHRSDKLTDGNPASIMNPSLFNPNIINQNKDYYYKELVSD